VRPWLIALLVVLSPLVAPLGVHAQATIDYDVIVIGSEPEAVSAAVAAAEAGARTLMITPDQRVGGLFVLGELSMLDLRTQPFNFQQGLFQRWWLRVGRGTGFDVPQAERAFDQLLDEAGVAVLRDAEVAPLLNGSGAVIGARSQGIAFRAGQVIDGSADMDFAAAAGAGYDVGFSTLGVEGRMADTLVFRIDGLDWERLRTEIAQLGRSYATIDDHVAWGHFGGVPAAYAPADPGLRLRGLNLGRQRDGTVLVNALLIYGLDPFDPASLAEGRARAVHEAERIVAYLAATIPAFDGARYGGAAERLYVRESRHLRALCTLTIDDVLDNRVTDLDVAAGGYPLDVQSLGPDDSGFVFGRPDIYGVRLCSAVPTGVSGLWVVGRSAGYDPLAASSARVVPFGMAFAEGVGVAAAVAAESGLEPSEIAADDRQIADIRWRLRLRGALLPSVDQRPPTGPTAHPHFGAYRLLRSRALALGGYDNDPRLDQTVPALSYVYLLDNVGLRFLDRDGLGEELIEDFSGASGTLDEELALAISYRAACVVRGCPSQPSWSGLERAGLIPFGFRPAEQVSRGEMYELAAGFARLATQ
jgi:hypothetical protein